MRVPHLLVLVAASCNGVASLNTISERTLRLQPEVEFELVARGDDQAFGDCFRWETARPDIAEIVSEECDNGESTVRVRTHAPATEFGGSARVFTFVTATPLDGRSDAVFCEVNVALIASLTVHTQVKAMLAHELQWLTLGAHDIKGNAFSLQGLAALEVDWSFDPDGLLDKLRPSDTQQTLDPALAAAERSGQWARYHQIAVRAGGKPMSAINVAAVLRNEQTVGEAQQRVVGRARLSIEPSELELLPSSRAVLAPSMRMQYALWRCGKNGRCSKPPPSPTSWSVLPPQIGGITSNGLLTAAIPGDGTVRVEQPLLQEAAEVLVTPPVKLRLELIDKASLHPTENLLGAAGRAAEASAESGGSSPPAVYSFRMGASARLLRLTVLSGPIHGNAPMLLPAWHVPRAGEDLALHLMPELRNADGGVLKTRRVPPWLCGESCTMERCERSGQMRNGCEAPHTLCLCEEVLEQAPGTSVVTGSLHASPKTLGDAPWPANGTWPRLEASLEIHLVRPLSLVPPVTTLPWVCEPDVKPAGASLTPLPLLSGGSGKVRWEVAPAVAAALTPASGSADGSTPLRVRALRPGTLDFTAHDTSVALSPARATVHVPRIESLHLSAATTHAAVGAAFDATIAFLGPDSSPLAFDACSALKLSWHLEARAGGDGDGNGEASSRTMAFRAAGGGDTLRGELSCVPRCPGGVAGPSVSCAMLRLTAIAAGVNTLHVLLDSKCGDSKPVRAALDLTAFAVPPPQTLRMCAVGDSGGLSGAHHLPLAAPLRDAALGGGLQVSANEALLTVSPPAVRGEEEGGDLESGVLALPVRCVRPHSQDATLSFTYAATMPPVSVRMAVLCAPPPAVGEGRGTLELGAGETHTLTLRGAWIGAAVSAELRGADAVAALNALSPSSTQQGTAGAAASVNGAPPAAGEWTSRLDSLAPGMATLDLNAFVDTHGRAAPGCARSVPLRVRIGGFTVACPSGSLLAGSYMICYALAATRSGVGLPPSAELLRGMQFEWSVDGSRRDAPPIAAAPLSSSAFAVRLSARVPGAATVRVGVAAADGTQYSASMQLLVVSPLVSRLAPPVAPAPAALVPPDVTVSLLPPPSSVHAAGRGGAPIEWSLCSAAATAAAAGAAAGKASMPYLSPGGELRSGSELGVLCVRAASGGSGTGQPAGVASEPRQEVMLSVEVRGVAQVRLVRQTTGELFDGGVSPGEPIALCAVAFDALGRPFLDVAMPNGWLQLSMLPTAEAAPAAIGTGVNGSCGVLTASHEWARAQQQQHRKAQLAIVDAVVAGVPATSTLAAAHAYVPLWPLSLRDAVAPPDGSNSNSCAASSQTAGEGSTTDSPPHHGSGSGGGGGDSSSSSSVLIAIALVLLLALAAVFDLRRSTRRPLPGINPREGPSLRGPYSPRHANPVS